MAEELKVTTAAEKRRNSTYLHRVSKDSVFRLKKVSMTTLVLNSLIPMPLLEAAQEYERLQAGGALPENMTDEEKRAEIKRLMAESPDVVRGWKDFLKHYASVVVTEPRVVNGPSDDPNVLSADELSADELLEILKAVPEEDREKEEADPALTKEAAQEFRGSAQPNDDTPKQDGSAVPQQAVLVDTPDREVIYA